MPDELLSVLWLCGPPGAGKSAVGWALYAGLSRSGARVGFAGIDQLGMCLPAPPDDPEGYRLKARWGCISSRGRVVLSGPVPDARAAAVHAGALPRPVGK